MLFSEFVFKFPKRMKEKNQQENKRNEGECCQFYKNAKHEHDAGDNLKANDER